MLKEKGIIKKILMMIIIIIGILMINSSSQATFYWNQYALKGNTAATSTYVNKAIKQIGNKSSTNPLYYYNGSVNDYAGFVRYYGNVMCIEYKSSSSSSANQELVGVCWINKSGNTPTKAWIYSSSSTATTTTAKRCAIMAYECTVAGKQNYASLSNSSTWQTYSWARYYYWADIWSKNGTISSTLSKYYSGSDSLSRPSELETVYTEAKNYGEFASDFVDNGNKAIKKSSSHADSEITTNVNSSNQTYLQNIYFSVVTDTNSYTKTSGTSQTFTVTVTCTDGTKITDTFSAAKMANIKSKTATTGSKR